MRLVVFRVKIREEKLFAGTNRALKVDVGDIPSNQMNDITTITQIYGKQGYIVLKRARANSDTVKHTDFRRGLNITLFHVCALLLLQSPHQRPTGSKIHALL